MENASKALLIAGGILLAMMIVALLLYMLSAMGDMQESQNNRLLTKQIEGFNKTYLAYDKRKMYGTDVITVVNKAIDHNKKIEAEETDPYYINVKIITTTDFKTTGKVIDNSKEPGASGYEKTLNDSEIRSITGISDLGISLNANNEGYNLGNWRPDGTLNLNKGIINFFVQGDNKQKEDGYKVYYIYSALTNFKRAIFTCEQMEDTEKDGKKDGRIDTIVFKQIS